MLSRRRRMYIRSQRRLQNGEGLLIRDPKINPPKVRSILKQIGNEPVSSLRLIRTPLSKLNQTLLNVASFGQLESKLKELNIDKLWHLSMLINNKYTLEKVEVIKLYSGRKQDYPNSEYLDIPVKEGITINSLLENTQKLMGDRYGSYNAIDNNCSIFLENVLKANGLLTTDADIFLKQRTEELFEKFPSLTRYLTKFATDLAAIKDRVIEGEGRMGKPLTNPL
jgi:hypothetical protein